MRGDQAVPRPVVVGPTSRVRASRRGPGSRRTLGGRPVRVGGRRVRGSHRVRGSRPVREGRRVRVDPLAGPRDHRVANAQVGRRAALVPGTRGTQVRGPVVRARVAPGPVVRARVAPGRVVRAQVALGPVVRGPVLRGPVDRHRAPAPTGVIVVRDVSRVRAAARRVRREPVGSPVPGPRIRRSPRAWPPATLIE